MKVRLHNPLTGRTRTVSAYFTTQHAASHYGQPVLIASGELLDEANAVLQAATIVTAPKRADQVRMLKRWQENARAMLGSYAAER